MGKIVDVVSVSGGKDSTATLLTALDSFTPVAVFADTGHEHPTTYEYVQYLNDQVHPIRTVRADFSDRINTRRANLPKKWQDAGISQERIDRALELLHPTGNPFLDLCMLKGRFPSTRARFCSQELKHIPIRRYVIDPLLDEGNVVRSWQGVRADESLARSKLPVNEHVEPGLLVYRPILHWTAEQVFELHRQRGVRWNPLYEQGMTRVGCMPCIHSRKDEIREIAARFPEEIKRVGEWEDLVSDVSKRGLASFFSSGKTTRDYSETDCFPIATVVEWSRTKRGGKDVDPAALEEPKVCSSIYGLCE